MTRSDWIATIAAIGTLLALVPPYHQYFVAKKKAKSKRATKTEPLESASEESKNEPPGPYARAAVLTAMAFLLFVVELVAFSWVANFFNVKVELDTMPLNWQVGFVSLFLVPGLLCFLALLNIVGTMSD